MKVMYSAVVLLVLIVVDYSIAEQDSYTQHQQYQIDGLSGLNDLLDPSGVEFSLSLTNIYQVNTKGGLSTHRRKGRWAGSYDLEMNADMEKLLGIHDAELYLHAEGTWSRQDIDGTSVGSAFGVNGDFAPRESLNVIELWYQQAFTDTLQLRIGKLDMAGCFEHQGSPVSFDGNLFANDETTQFLNSALVNNPTIPLPDYGLGAILHWDPVDLWYLSTGVADASADKRETGLNTAFGDEDYFVYMLETGVTPQLNSANGPLQGTYRVGMWYDPQPKAHSDASRQYRDDMGFYVSSDQQLTRESDKPDDSQGLGAFFRYGYAPSRANDITCFYSFGLQYQGLFDGRDDDVFGLGYAHGSFSDRADTTYTEDYESVTELYYSAHITQWMTISPSVQYVTNPGGDSSIQDAVVAGLRAQISF